MELQPYDLHGVFSDADNRFRLWNARHEQIWQCEMRNASTGGTGYGHNAECPPGTYRVGAAVPKNTPPFGAFFLPLQELPGHHEFDDRDRAGIGIHAGGSDLPSPLALHQGWEETHGCLRVQGFALLEFVSRVHAAHAQGGVVYVTVAADG